MGKNPAEKLPGRPPVDNEQANRHASEVNHAAADPKRGTENVRQSNAKNQYRNEGLSGR
jgi:hypothetical protein